MRRYRFFIMAVLTVLSCLIVACQEKSASAQRDKGVFCLTAGGGDVELTGIILSGSPSFLDSTAAGELRKYIKEFFGTDLPILTPAQGEKDLSGRILVGEAAIRTAVITQEQANAVGEGGYLIRSSDGCLALAGGSADGTVNGVYAFLEEMGAKFLSADVHLAPAQKLAIVPEMSLARSPAFKFRCDFAPDQPGYTHQYVIGNPRELGSRHSWVHTADFLLEYEKYHTEHPEYFALMKDGRRLEPDPKSWRFDVHVCMSNPQVRAEAAKNLLAWIEAQPQRKYFMVSQGDGRGDKWCQCKQCQAQDAVPGKVMTDRLLEFVNHLARRVAAKYPDKVLFTLAYTEATGPVPVRVKPEPNVRVMYCPYPWDWGCQSHAFCEKNKKGMKDLADWVALCPKQLFIFDYPVGYKQPMEIMGSFYAMADKIRYYARSGIEGVQFCGSPRGFNSLFKYVMNELMWDPETDLEKTIDEFMALYYGKEAGPVMREYFDLIYKEIRERPVHQMCEGDNPGLVTEEFAKKGYRLFERATQAAGGDQELLRRIRDEKLFLLYSDIHVRHKVNGMVQGDMESYAAKLAEFTRIVREQKMKNYMRRTPMHKFFRDTARLKFQEEHWYDDPAVDRFLADPLAMLKD